MQIYCFMLGLVVGVSYKLYGLMLLLLAVVLVFTMQLPASIGKMCRSAAIRYCYEDKTTLLIRALGEMQQQVVLGKSRCLRLVAVVAVDG